PHVAPSLGVPAMSRIALPLLLAVSSLAFAPAPLPRPDRTGDLGRLQGGWLLVSKTVGGRTQQESPERVWTFRGSQLRISYGWLSDEWEVSLDPRASPRTMQTQTAEFREPGTGRPRVVRYLYRIDGDRLVVCYDGARWGRPPADLDGQGSND